MAQLVDRIDRSSNRSEDPRNREVVHAANDPQVGNLATPINASALTRSYINRLSAYRPGISIQRRGLEIGLAHGYWLVGPFATFNPLRHTHLSNFIGLLSALGMVLLATLAILLYAASRPLPPIAPITTQPAPEFKTVSGWTRFATSFFIGGVAGAGIAYGIIATIPVYGNFLRLIGVQ